jgi:hypothetical protein
LGLKRGLTRWHKYVKVKCLVLISDFFEGLEGYVPRQEPSRKEAAQLTLKSNSPKLFVTILVAAIQKMAPKMPKNETK